MRAQPGRVAAGRVVVAAQVAGHVGLGPGGHLAPVLVGPGHGRGEPRRRAVGVEAEARLEHLVGELLELLAALLRVDRHVLPQLVLRLLVRIDGRLAGSGALAAVPAGGHPHAGEAVGGLADGGLALGAEEFAEGEHGLGEAVLDDAAAGVGEQLAEVGAAVAGHLLEVVGVVAELVGDGFPGGAAGAEFGGPGEEFVGRGGHDGTRGEGGRIVYMSTVSCGLARVNRYDWFLGYFLV